MIKIEKLTEGCSALLKSGKALIKGQLIDNNELDGIKVLNGTLTISIDELEIREITAAQEIDSVKTPEQLEASDTLALKQLNQILTEANSAKTPQNLDSAKSTHKK